MPTYLYECPAHGEFEFSHPINEELKLCPKCQDEKCATIHEVKKLIASGTTFILNGGGWSKDNYH